MGFGRKQTAETKASLFYDKTRPRCRRLGVRWPYHLNLVPALLGTCRHIHTEASEVLYAHDFNFFAGPLSDSTPKRCIPFGEDYVHKLRTVTCVFTTHRTTYEPDWFAKALRAADATLTKHPLLTNLTTTIIMSESFEEGITHYLSRQNKMTGAQYAAYVKDWTLSQQQTAMCKIAPKMSFVLQAEPRSYSEYFDVLFKEVSDALGKAIGEVRAANASVP